jgi:dedicated sortase system histidine kinase
MSLRIRLLLLSLFTLVLPWAGWEYARQMEDVLRSGQEGALLTTAKTLGRVVIADSDLVEQSFPQRPADSAGRKLFAAQLTTNPLLDGLIDEWPPTIGALPTDAATGKLRLGVYGAAFYAFMHVSDAQVRYESPGTGDRPNRNNYDRILVVSRDQSGVERAWSLSAVAPGPLIVRQANPVSPWKPALAEDDSEVRGAWRETTSGFDVELRIPTRLIGWEFAIVHLDDATPAPDALEMWALSLASETLRDKLALYAAEGLRISIVDNDGWLLARAGTLQAFAADGRDESPSAYRWFLGRSEQLCPAYSLPYGMWGPPVDSALAGRSTPIWCQAGGGEPSTVRASIPIAVSSSILGVITVEQAGSRLLLDRDAALTGLLGFTFLVALLAVAAAIVFAAWLSRRIRRLSVAAADALTPSGDVNDVLPETASGDELGDLARSYAVLLQKLKEYTQYLRTLGSKLSHEFRTPLAIVSSSLENLAAEKHSHDQTYIQRAREGTARLQNLLIAMTEATRVEQSIETAERVDFDLADLLRGVGTAYAQTFSTHRIEVAVPTDSCPLHGAPELIVQMLDKLIDNAVDYCPNGQRISIALSSESKHYRLTVSNEGPLLAPGAEHKMFDMLISDRTGESEKPHLGLGLFIVQLIARFHGGLATGRNMSDLSGVEFEIQLPKPRQPSK